MPRPGVGRNAQSLGVHEGRGEVRVRVRLRERVRARAGLGFGLGYGLGFGPGLGPRLGLGCTWLCMAAKVPFSVERTRVSAASSCRWRLVRDMRPVYASPG